MSISNGGQAFPAAAPDAFGDGLATQGFYREGMTLRDYFAAKAMPALIVDPERLGQSREECARLSYLMADAMLKAREEVAK